MIRMAVDDTSLKSGYQSFLTQYTALVLLVLTFIIAVFFKPDAFGNGLKHHVVKPVSFSVGILSIDVPFKSDGLTVNAEAFSGITFALQNHDLSATIEVTGGSEEENLARSMEIFKYLIQQNIPTFAIRAYGRAESTNKLSVQVQLYEDPKD